jgi:hypothetical protein
VRQNSRNYMVWDHVELIYFVVPLMRKACRLPLVRVEKSESERISRADYSIVEIDGAFMQNLRKSNANRYLLFLERRERVELNRVYL